MIYVKDKLQQKLKKEYNMENTVFPLVQEVVFYGSELECYRMTYIFKNKESRVNYSKNLNTWSVTFPKWFTIEFSQKII